MLDPILVSIITPSFNSGAFIERTIQSVLAQDYGPIEHIVVDGGSTDDTLAILKRYPHLHWISEPDHGQSDALNKGFRMARGEIVGWLNADDTYTPGAVGAAVAALEANPETALVYSHCNLIDEHDKITHRLIAPPFDLSRELVAHDLPQPTNFFRAQALADVGYLATDLHYIMDWDLYLRLGVNHSIKLVDAVWANFRECEGTKSVAHWERFWVEAITMFDRFFAQPGLPAEIEQIKSLAYGRALWKAGIFHHALCTDAGIAAGQRYCQQALQTHPLFTQDLDFTLAQLTDCALRRFGVAQADSFVRQVISALPGPKPQASQWLRRALGHLYAAMALTIREPSARTPTGRRRWLRQAIQNDPRWLGNGGIRSLVVRETWQALRERLQA